MAADTRPGSPARRPDRWRIAAAAAAIVGMAGHWIAGIVHVRPADFEPAAAQPADAGPLAPVLAAPAVQLASAAQAALPAQPAAPVLAPLPVRADDPPLHYRERFAPSAGTAQVHASSAVAQTGGGLSAFWYGGSREGAQDVAIYGAQLGADGAWTPARRVVELDDVVRSQGRYVRKLGNATVHRHPDGRIWMIFVTVAVGGWAGSSLNLSESRDNGQTWSPPRRLVTSPFFNVSTLVRGDPIRYVDGSIGLPVYHEFIGKFAELVRIAPDGRILSKTRLSTGRDALQPELVVTGPQEAFGVLRYAGPPPRRLLRVATTDGGRTWSAPARITLANPNAAFDLAPIGNGELIAVVNDSEEHRDRLTLAHSTDLGRTWTTLSTFDLGRDSGPERDEYSYPWLLRTADGRFHVLYTWNRTRIKHVEFSAAWLAARRRAMEN